MTSRRMRTASWTGICPWRAIRCWSDCPPGRHHVDRNPAGLAEVVGSGRMCGCCSLATMRSAREAVGAERGRQLGSEDLERDLAVVL